MYITCKCKVEDNQITYCNLHNSAREMFILMGELAQELPEHKKTYSGDLIHRVETIIRKVES